MPKAQLNRMVTARGISGEKIPPGVNRLINRYCEANRTTKDRMIFNKSGMANGKMKRAITYQLGMLKIR